MHVWTISALTGNGKTVGREAKDQPERKVRLEEKWSQMCHILKSSLQFPFRAILLMCFPAHVFGRSVNEYP